MTSPTRTSTARKLTNPMTDLLTKIGEGYQLRMNRHSLTFALYMRGSYVLPVKVGTANGLLNRGLIEREQQDSRHEFYVLTDAGRAAATPVVSDLAASGDSISTPTTRKSFEIRTAHTVNGQRPEPIASFNLPGEARAFLTSFGRNPNNYVVRDADYADEMPGETWLIEFYTDVDTDVVYEVSDLAAASDDVLVSEGTEATVVKMVYKYPLTGPVNGVRIPAGAELLHVDAQRGEMMLWALVNPDAPNELRAVVIAGTGYRIDETIIRHINSFLLGGGDAVFHAFEVQP